MKLYPAGRRSEAENAADNAFLDAEYILVEQLTEAYFEFITCLFKLQRPELGAEIILDEIEDLLRELEIDDEIRAEMNAEERIDCIEELCRLSEDRRERATGLIVTPEIECALEQLRAIYRRFPWFAEG